MTITTMVPVLDAANIDEVSTFWAGLLGGTVTKNDDWHSVGVDGTTRIEVQHAPDHVRPDWPGGQPQQVHLDIYVTDIAADHVRAVSLGATPLGELKDLTAASGFQVYADPAGHPFCLCWS
jgi:predicted enzyme related to lactoylglutathione lyase